MTKYVFTSKEAKEQVNLQEYEQIIADTVLDVVLDCEPLVSIAEDYFAVEMDPSMTDEEWTEINKILGSTELGEYQVEGQMLFSVVEE